MLSRLYAYIYAKTSDRFTLQPVLYLTEKMMFKNALQLLLLICPLVLGATEPLPRTPPAKTADSRALVAGCIDAATGNYLEHCVDLVVDGPEPIELRRVFVSSEKSKKRYGQWQLWREYVDIGLKLDGSTIQWAYLVESDGATTGFHGWVLKANAFVGGRELSPGADVHSGVSRPKNYKLSAAGPRCELITGYGELRTYGLWREKEGKAKAKLPSGEQGYLEHGPIRRIYLLSEVIRPSGNRLLYSHDGEGCLKRIEARSCDDALLGWVDLSWTYTGKNWDVCVTSSDGQELHYVISKDQTVLHSVTHPSGLREEFTYNEKDGKLLTHKYAEKRALVFGYEENTPWAAPVKISRGRAKPRHLGGHRVTSIRRVPSRFSPMPDMPAQLQYRVEGKGPRRGEPRETDVCDGMGGRSTLSFDNEGRLEAIRYYGRRLFPFAQTRDKLRPLLTKRISWKYGTGYPSYETIEDADGREVCRRGSEYHAAGNVTCQFLQGDLRGRGGKDAYRKETRYNDQDLPIEETDGFYRLRLAHTEDTRRLKSRLTYSCVPTEELVRREFFRYDDWAQLVEQVEDDGVSEDPSDLSGVTYRKIIRTTRRREAPALGFPDEVETLLFDSKTASERLLGRKRYEYDARNLPVKEHVYDADGVHRYTLEREYDKARRIISETDPLGSVYTYTYDEFGNVTESTGPNGLYETRRSYNSSNQPTAIELRDQEGNAIVREAEFNSLDQLSAEIDEYGNGTFYSHDKLGRQNKVTLPRVMNPEGEKARPIIKREYDALGNVIAETNPLGETTRRTHTAHGKVASITHPDGTTESFEYNEAGHLLSHVARSGLRTEFECDGLGRVLVKRLISQNGELLSEISKSYKGTLVTSTTNAEGQTAYFTYDGAGRLVEMVCADQRTTYAYDALGRKARTCEWLTEKQCCISIWEYDAKDRVVEERVEDQTGRILKRFTYAYDAVGRCAEETIFDDEGHPQTKRTEYDLLGRPVSVVDSEGHELRISYETVSNALGQRVLCKTVTEPSGVSTVVTYDALGRVVSKETRSGLGHTLDAQEFTYDLMGNQVEERHEIQTPEGATRTVTHRWVYGVMGRLTRMEEAAGDAKVRITRYTYDACGRVGSVQKPSGEVLHRSYDALGRLSRFYGPSFDYHYTYDRNDQLVAVEDGEGRRLERCYNALGQLISETLPTGLNVSFDRDALGRCTRIVLPDGSSIGYEHDAAYLQRVLRFDDEGHLRYAHTYSRRNLNGMAIEEDLPFGLGVLSHGSDALGMQRTVASPFHGCWTPDGGVDEVGNVLSLKLQDGDGTYSCDYSYDEQSQLASESGVEKHNYLMDSRGDLVSQDDQSFDTDPLGAFLEPDGELTFDEDGRLIERRLQERVTRYAYDALDRLIEVELPDAKLIFGYDVFHRRISKQRYVRGIDGWVLELDLQFLYAGREELGAVDASGSIIQLRVPGEGAEAVAIELDSEVYVPLHSLRGDVTCLVSPDGEVIESYRYTAFGHEVNGSQRGNPWRFGGRRVDDETGFVLFGHRYYWAGSGLGHWTTPDPLGYVAGPNLYAYCSNNPLRYRDLSGLAAGSLLDTFTDRSDVLGGSRPVLTDRLPLPSQDTGLPIEYNPPPLTSRPPKPQPEPMTDGNYRPLFGRPSERICQNPNNPYNDPNYVSVPSQRPRSGPIAPIVTHLFYGDFEKPFANKSRFLAVPCPATRACGIGFCNGIMTSFSEFTDHLVALSEMANGDQVWGIYNATHGFSVDLTECTLNMMGVSTNPSHLLHQMWFEYFDRADPDGVFLMICHSQGAILVRNALKTFPESLRKRIKVVAIAPAAYIEDKYCMDVVHYVSRWDPVPTFDVVGRQRCLHSTVILEPHPDAPFWDHGFWSPTYVGRMRLHIHEHQE